jgi:SAM-dependent methyltransferase
MNSYLIAMAGALSTQLFAGGMQQPATYAQNSSLQWNLVTESYGSYPWKGNERVLDVGCGHGALSAVIAENVPHGYVLGVDLSEKMIAYASETISKRNLVFLTGSATALPFYNQFDLVVSSFTLHWVLEQEKAYASLYKCLVPGGKLLVVEAARRNNYVGPLTEELVKQTKWAPHFTDYKNQRVYLTENEAQMLLERVGFIPLSIKVTTTTTLFDGKLALINYLKPQLTFIAHLSEELQDEFANDLADAMIASCQVDEQGTIAYPLDKIEILAQKPL